MSRWFFRPTPNPDAQLRLFCFPYAGAGATLYRNWPASLPPEVEVYALQPPGRELRIKEPPFTTLTPLVSATVQEILPFLDRPFALLGYCVGAVAAFEVARTLQHEHNQVPAHLFVAARAAPKLPETGAIHKLPDAEIIAHLDQSNATPKEILSNPQLLNMLLPTIRADFQVGETYTYMDGPQLTCGISAFRGSQDKDISANDIAHWQAETSGPFASRTLPGGHFFINSSPALLLQMIRKSLKDLLNTPLSP